MTIKCASGNCKPSLTGQRSCAISSYEILYFWCITYRRKKNNLTLLQFKRTNDYQEKKPTLFYMDRHKLVGSITYQEPDGLSDLFQFFPRRSSILQITDNKIIDLQDNIKLFCNKNHDSRMFTSLAWQHHSSSSASPALTNSPLLNVQHSVRRRRL